MTLRYSLVFAGLSLVGAVAVPLAASAQDTPPAVAASPRQPPDPQAVVGMLAVKLGLSDAQKAQIEPVIADRQQKMAALKADTSLRPRQKMGQIKALYADSDQKILAVLNDSQKTQYQEIEQQMRDQMRQRMSSRGAAGATAQ